MKRRKGRSGLSIPVWPGFVLWLDFATLDGNSHGPKVLDPEDEDGFRFETLRSTVRLVTIENLARPRNLWAKGLWLYAPSGACCCFYAGVGRPGSSD